ncbi:MAG: SRPBCC domain-containing protein [Dehalococcoidia bacterium]
MPEQTDRIEASIVVNVARPVVWEALTDTHQLGHWFGSVFDETQVETGAVLHARMEGAPDGQEDWTATVETVEPGSTLSWRWQPGPPNLPAGEPLTLVTFTLTDEGEGTRITVVETGFAALSRERWDLVFPMNTGGWEGVFSAITEWVGDGKPEEHDHDHDHHHDHDHSGAAPAGLPDRIEASIVMNARRERVWQALVDPRQLGAWFNVELENDVIEPGVELRGKILHPGFEHVTWKATIEAVEPPRLLSWRWHPGAADPDHDYSGEPETLCTFVLEDADGGTRVSFTESGFDALPRARWAEGFEMNKDGWAMVLEAIADGLAR